MLKAIITVIAVFFVAWFIAKVEAADEAMKICKVNHSDSYCQKNIYG